MLKKAEDADKRDRTPDQKKSKKYNDRKKEFTSLDKKHREYEGRLELFNQVKAETRIHYQIYAMIAGHKVILATTAKGKDSE